MTRLCALSVILFAAALAAANANVDGYVYQASTGYWVWPTDGTLWQRTTYPIYDHGYLRYGVQYVQVVKPRPAEIKYTPTWKEEAVKLLNEREDRNLFDRTMAMLGATSTAPLPAAGGYYGSSSYGAHGTTIYAHQHMTIKDVWGDSSPALLFQQLNALAKNQQQLSGDAVAAFAELVGQDATARARIAEIMANRDAAVAFLQALKTSQSRTVEKSFTWKIGPNGLPHVEDKGPPAKFDPKAFETRVIAQCGACHAGKDIKGGFALSSLPEMNKGDKLGKVWARLTHATPGKRMPLGVGLGPGTPQTAEELRAWWHYLFELNSAKMPEAR